MKIQCVMTITIFLLIHQIYLLCSIVSPINCVETKVAHLRQISIKSGLGDPGDEVVKAIILAQEQTGLSENLLLALIYSESSYDKEAISSKGYQGLMQIPKSQFHFHKSEDVNVLIGAKILLEKLVITNHNLKNALILYKGWKIGEVEGEKQAEKVIKLARKLRDTDL